LERLFGVTTPMRHGERKGKDGVGAVRRTSLNLPSQRRGRHGGDREYLDTRRICKTKKYKEPFSILGWGHQLQKALKKIKGGKKLGKVGGKVRPGEKVYVMGPTGGKEKTKQVKKNGYRRAKTKGKKKKRKKREGPTWSRVFGGINTLARTSQGHSCRKDESKTKTKRKKGWQLRFEGVRKSAVGGIKKGSEMEIICSIKQASSSPTGKNPKGGTLNKEKAEVNKQTTTKRKGS